MGIGGLFGGIGGAVSDLFAGQAAAISAQGDYQAAASYNYGAFLEDQNVGTETTALQIQQTQMDRKIAKVEGQGVAAEGAANVSGGSAGDIMRENIQQGALAKTMINTQGQLQINGYKEQATAMRGEAAAANAAGDAAMKQSQMAPFSAGLSLLGGVFGMFG